MKERKALYVVSHEYTSLTKIGVSKSLQTRINSIRTSIGADLTIYYESPSMDNWREIELEVIRNFKTKETAGEWVLATPQEIIEYIKTIEHKFDNPEYYFQELDIDKYAEKIEQVPIPFYYEDISYNKLERKLQEVYKGVYRDDNYIFYVSYHLGVNIITVAFNVYKTAEKFAKGLKKRLVLLDLENKEFIKNPKFRIENE